MITTASSGNSVLLLLLDDWIHKDLVMIWLNLTAMHNSRIRSCFVDIHMHEPNQMEWIALLPTSAPTSVIVLVVDLSEALMLFFSDREKVLSWSSTVYPKESFLDQPLKASKRPQMRKITQWTTLWKKCWKDLTFWAQRRTLSLRSPCYFSKVVCGAAVVVWPKGASPYDCDRRITHSNTITN